MKIGSKVIFKKDAPSEYPQKRIFVIDSFIPNWGGIRVAMLRELNERLISIRFVDINHIKVLKRRRK